MWIVDKNNRPTVRAQCEMGSTTVWAWPRESRASARHPGCTRTQQADASRHRCSVQQRQRRCASNPMRAQQLRARGDARGQQMRRARGSRTGMHKRDGSWLTQRPERGTAAYCSFGKKNSLLQSSDAER
jgi:hypothetical protein